MDFRKIGAEVILTVMILPAAIYIYSSLTSLEKADAIHDVRYEHILEKLQNIEDKLKEIDHGKGN